MNALHSIYRHLDSSAEFQDYRARHGIESANVLSVVTPEIARQIADRLAPIVTDRVVVEIGGGTGLLGIALGAHARRVFCIEANPYWSFMFVQNLIGTKPRNVSFLMGSAEEFAGTIRGDVALFCTHTSVPQMTRIASEFADRVIDVYGELFGRDAQAAEDMIARLKAAAG